MRRCYNRNWNETTAPKGFKVTRMQKDFDVINGIFREYRGSDTDIIIPDGVTVIGKNAFYNCTNLKSVLLPGRPI